MLAVLVVAAVLVGLTASPYDGAGTWLSRYRVTRESSGGAPRLPLPTSTPWPTPGVRTIHLRPVADDPAYPGLLNTDLLGEFLVRAHERDVRVVAWYLPRFTDADGALRRLRQVADFRAGGQGCDAIAVDIEFTEDAALPQRNAALVDLSRRLREHLGGPCAVVSLVGGYDVEQTAEGYAGMVRAAAEQQAIGVSVWDWPSTPASAWPSVSGYAGRGC